MSSRWIIVQILSFTAAVVFSLFAIGHLITGPASTAVGTLSIDFPVKPVQFSIESESPVHGWLAYGEPGNGAILLVHSMRSNRLEMLSRSRFLHQQGYNVLLIDLQAHGESPGKRITFGARESENVEAAINFLRETFPFERIGAIGVSLGAAAIVLTKHNLNLDAIVLESLHSTIEEAVENRLKLHLGEFASALLPLLLFQFTFYLDIPTDELNPIAKIDNLNTPLLLISGTKDAHTSLTETERLFAAARDPKEIWLVPGAGHFNMHNYAGKSYEDRILTFMGQYLR